jgi:hypothetical protein
MASSGAPEVSLVSSSGAPSITLVYDASRVRRAVYKANGKVDITATYADIFLEGSKDEQTCAICARAALLLGAPAPEPLTSLKTSSNRVSHIAHKHPAELVDEHAKLDYVITALRPSSSSSVKKSGSTGVVVGPIDRLFKSAGALPTDYDFVIEWALMILEDARPFTFIEGSGFDRFWTRSGFDRYFGRRRPSADTIARRAVIIDEALQLELSNNIFPSELGYTDSDSVEVIALAASRAKESGFTFFSASVDCWTSQSGMPVLGSTLHYITPKWTMRDLALCARVFEPPHTAEATDELFGAILQEYGLPQEHMLGLATDSASVMILFADMLKAPHIRCINHAIHNVVTNLMKDIDFATIIDAPLKLGNFFSNIATTRNHIVKEKAAEMDKPEPPKVVKAVETRWNSHLNAIGTHLRRWDVISQLEAKDLKITDSSKALEYNTLHATCITYSGFYRGIVDILSPVEAWSLRLQASGTPTLSLLYLARREITTGLKPVSSDSTLVAKFRSKLLERMQTAFDIVAPLTVPTGPNTEKDKVRFKMVAAAAALDIRTAGKQAPMTSVNMALLSDYIALSYLSWQLPPSAPKDNSYLQLPDNDGGSDSAELAAIAAMQKQVHTGASQPEPGSPVVDAVLLAQVKQQLADFAQASLQFGNLSIADRLKVDTLAWWRDNEGKFPVRTVTSASKR